MFLTPFRQPRSGPGIPNRRARFDDPANVVVGAPQPDLDLSYSHLRRWADPAGSRNTLIALARAWIAIDVDGYGVPSPLGEAAPR